MNTKKEKEMLIHITPQIFCLDLSIDIKLSCVLIPELSAVFQNGMDIIATRPHNNKGYLVARSKKRDTKAAGLIIEAPFISNFTSLTYWQIQYKELEYTAIHKVTYTVEDDVHDFVTDNILIEDMLIGRRFSGRRSPPPICPTLSVFADTKYPTDKHIALQTNEGIKTFVEERTQSCIMWTCKYRALSLEKAGLLKKLGLPNTIFQINQRPTRYN